MSDSFGLKVYVDGEKEYKSALADINAALKTAGSALVLTQSQFQGNANNMEALTAKGGALSNVLAAQQDKLTKLGDALQSAKDAQTRASRLRNRTPCRNGKTSQPNQHGR